MRGLYFLLMLAFIIPSQGYEKPDKVPSKLTDQQRWAIGASGVLASRNRMRFDSLEGEELNKFTIKNCQDLIKEWWGIENKADLLRDLQWLQNGGHSAKFEELAADIDAIEVVPGPTVIRAEFEALLKNNDKLRAKIEIVTKYHDVLGDKSLYGWDVSRYICLCRWGFISGYITEEEAWEKIMPAARFVQQTFDSWEDFGMNYLIGRKFWSPLEDDHHIYKDAYMRLFEMPSSPWKELPWDLPLGGEDAEYRKNIKDYYEFDLGTLTANLDRASKRLK